jgi:lysophospholipase L1-like esterase
VSAGRQRLAARLPARSVQVEDEAGSNYRERRAARAAAAVVTDVTPPVAAYRAFALRVDDLIAACRERGVRPVFLTHPVLWKKEMPPAEDALLWLGGRPDGSFVSAAGLRAAIDVYNGIVVRICEERGVELVDLREMNGDPRWFYDDCHFNEAGAAEVARRVAEHLHRSGLSRPTAVE